MVKAVTEAEAEAGKIEASEACKIFKKIDN